jgi:hypothetical protein
MLLVLNKNNIDINKISILDKINNNILSNGYFHRIIYNSTNFFLNGIYFYFSLNNFKIENYFNKYKCTFNIKDNTEIISVLKNLEKSIMDNEIFKNQKGVYRIAEQLEQGYLKLYTNNDIKLISYKDNVNFLLKLSGIWSENDCHGLTFRFCLSIGDE